MLEDLRLEGEERVGGMRRSRAKLDTQQRGPEGRGEELGLGSGWEAHGQSGSWVRNECSPFSKEPCLAGKNTEAGGESPRGCG